MVDVKRIRVRPKRKRRKALYFTFEKERFRVSVGKKNASRERKNIILSTLEGIVKTLDFNTISTMVMEDDEGAKSKKHANDYILESKMKTSLGECTLH